ncbi:MAG: aa3-type cytochrome c oxidase subunit IV [Caulobacteraceae bacterium]
MAEQHVEHYSRGDMDIEAHKAAFHAFILMSKWGSLAVACGVLALVLWFCTPGGFLPGVIAPAIVAVVGFLILREKPAAAH